MQKNIKFQLKLLFTQKSFVITMMVMIVFSCVAFIVNCITIFGRPITNVPNVYFFFIGSALSESMYYILSVILPLAAALPFADSYFKERKDNLLPVVLLKSSRSTYYFSKGIAVFFSGFFIAFIPLLLNNLLNFIVFPVTAGCDFTMFPTYDSDFFVKGFWLKNIILKDFFISSPYLYNLFFLFAISTVSGLYAVIIYNLSFFVKKQHLLLLTSAFVLSNLCSILSSITPGFRIRLEDYCYAFTKMEAFPSVGFWCMLVLYGALLLLPIPFCLKKLRDAI